MASEPPSGDGGDEPFRLLVTPAADGAWNMSVDQALLEQAATSGQGALRFYAWQEPTLSLGYFQPWQERERHAASLRCACVRRSSGGGAILHDQELTYSIAVPPGHRLARRAEELYETVHASLTGLLYERLGIVAILAEKRAPVSGAEAFLCFQRRAGGDVVIGDTKVAGSAQRRFRGAVLQHGSILLRRSEWASELPGLDAFSDQPIAWRLLASWWQQPLATALGLTLIDSELGSGEIRLAEQIAECRYSQVAWTRRR